MSRINLTDDADTIAKKIKKAKTDSAPALPESEADLKEDQKSKNSIRFTAPCLARAWRKRSQPLPARKPALLKLRLPMSQSKNSSPITQRMNELLQDKAEIDRILKDGTQIAAQKPTTVDEAKKIMGL